MHRFVFTFQENIFIKTKIIGPNRKYVLHDLKH